MAWQFKCVTIHSTSSIHTQFSMAVCLWKTRFSPKWRRRRCWYCGGWYPIQASSLQSFLFPHTFFYAFTFLQHKKKRLLTSLVNKILGSYSTRKKLQWASFFWSNLAAYSSCLLFAYSSSRSSSFYFLHPSIHPIHLFIVTDSIR